MTYKSLMVHLQPNGDNEGVLNIAAALAQRLRGKAYRNSRPSAAKAAVRRGIYRRRGDRPGPSRNQQRTGRM